jgi:hypothetical protein
MAASRTACEIIEPLDDGSAEAMLAEVANAGAETPCAFDAGAGEPEIGEIGAAVRDARLFRAALADIFELQASRIAADLARAVLARELVLAPPDIAAIAAALIAQSLADEPLRLRVAPEAANLRCAVPVVGDERLEPGDAVLECRYGSIDARLKLRLANVLGELAR